MSRSGIILSRLEAIIDLPISLPQTELRVQDSIVVAFFKVGVGQRLDMGWLCLKLLNVLIPEGEDPVKVNTSLGLVYAGLYAGGFDPVRRPSGTPMHVISLSGPVSRILNPVRARSFDGPDIISVVVVNNTTNVLVDVTLVGSAKLLAYA
jgi:hypothetical protein